MPNKTEERRALVARLMAEGHATARSVAVALKDEHGVDAHRSTVARDMEVLRSGTKDAGPPEGKRDAIVARYEERIRSLTAMLRDEGLSKREARHPPDPERNREPPRRREGTHQGGSGRQPARHRGGAARTERFQARKAQGDGRGAPEEDGGTAPVGGLRGTAREGVEIPV